MYAAPDRKAGEVEKRGEGEKTAKEPVSVWNAL
jgi:hypothetical protein